MGQDSSTLQYSISPSMPSPSTPQSARSKVVTVRCGEQTLTIEVMEASITMGWLLSQAIRMYTGDETLVALRSERSEDVLDVHLLTMSRNCSVLMDGERLVAVFAGTRHLESVPPYMSVSHFHFEKVVGKGSYSTVVQARRRDTGALFAAKVMNKRHIIKEGKVAQVLAELRILTMVDHPFVVRLHQAFQSVMLMQSSYLYLILDFCPGGELFYHLHHIGRFTEEQAKFYFAEVLLAIGYLHELNVLYRDLKPENILLDADGHVRLTDFGVSKENISATTRRYSFCGSPEYMSPEMLQSKGHSRSLDFYCLGVFLYEMLTGLPPFYSNNKTKMYKAIQTEDVAFPPHLSKAACTLMSRLLDKNPDTRLGSSGGIEEVKAQPWLSNVPWEKILNKTKAPPFIPNLRQSNFDREYTSLPIDFPDYETPVLEIRGSFSDSLEDPFLNFKHPRDDSFIDTSASVLPKARAFRHILSSLSDASQTTKETSKRSSEILGSDSFHRHETLYLADSGGNGARESKESGHRHHNSQEFLADRVLMLQNSQTKRYQSPLRFAPQAALFSEDDLSAEYHSPKFCSPPPSKVHGPAFVAVKVEPKKTRRLGSSEETVETSEGARPKRKIVRKRE